MSGVSNSKGDRLAGRREKLRDELRELVQLIPAGRVLTYGDLAEDLGTGARQVGQAMASINNGVRATNLVPWWRVVNASGALPAHLWSVALPHYRFEQTPINADATRVALRTARWQGIFYCD